MESGLRLRPLRDADLRKAVGRVSDPMEVPMAGEVRTLYSSDFKKLEKPTFAKRYGTRVTAGGHCASCS